ncbi:MAG: hypothetical protein KDD61_03715 [Bdellovibrionales bacterium]|nr:hypothetical protein [Bdellovibrionales bacterium]
MKNILLIVSLILTFSAVAEDGIIFATKDDIRAFDKLIMKNRVRNVKRKEPRPKSEVRQLVQKEFQRNRKRKRKGLDLHNQEKASGPTVFGKSKAPSSSSGVSRSSRSDVKRGPSQIHRGRHIQRPVGDKGKSHKRPRKWGDRFKGR